MNTLPKAKTDNIVVQNLPNETLIYNLATNQAFCLNETSAKVFELCDGKTSFDELKAKHQLTDDLIYLALDELKANDLLENYAGDHFAGVSRREAIKRVGLACAVALPLIAAISAPTSASAASVCPENTIACRTTSDCDQVSTETCRCPGLCSCVNDCCRQTVIRPCGLA